MEIVLKVQNLIKTFIFLILLLASPVFTVPLFFLALVPRSVVWILAKVFRPDLDSFVIKLHAGLAVRSGTKATLNILGTSVLGGTVTQEQFRASFKERILSLKDPITGKCVYSGLKRSWEGFLGYAFWREDPNFELKNHVRDYDYGGKLQLPNPCSREDYNKVLPLLVEAPWKTKRSPWEFLVIPNYKDEEGSGKTVVVIRIDHALADGYSIIELVRRITGSSFSVPEFKLAARKLTLREKFGLAFKIPWDLARNAGIIVGAPKLQHEKKFSGEEVIVSRSPKIKVELIKEIKNHFKVSYAAVVYAAIFGALERALRVAEQKGPERLVSGFLLPKRGHPDGLSFHTTAMFADWPMTNCSSVERLQRIHRNFKSLNNSSAALAYPYIAYVGAYFPMFVRRLMLESMIDSGLSIAFSNFPVTTGPEFYEGHEIQEISVTLGMLPLLGMLMVTGGVNNQQIFSFTVDKSVFASSHAASQLGLYVEEEFHSLVAAMV